MITISVIMPVYNVAPYVERCLLSVMRQTRPAEECLIIDDASTDNSIALCERLIANYDGPTRFTILHHNHNRGLSAARNTGTNAATSTYIYYVDSDDEMTTNCLEKLAAPVEHDDSIEMVMGDFNYDYSAMKGWRYRLSRMLGTPQPRFMQDTPSALKSNQEIRDWFYKGKMSRPVSVWNRLLKRSFIKEHQLYNKEGRLHEDILWMYYLLRCLNQAAFVHEVTYIYHRRPGSICTGTNNEERLRHRGYSYREIAEHIVPGERLEEIMHWHKEFCFFYIDAHDNPDFQFAYHAFRRALTYPQNLSLVPGPTDRFSPTTYHRCQAPAIGFSSSSHRSDDLSSPPAQNLSPVPGPTDRFSPTTYHWCQAPAIGSAHHLSPVPGPNDRSTPPYSAGQLRLALWLLTTVHFLSKSRVGRFLFKTALRLRLLLLRILHVLQSITGARPQR